jgi:hypothetical protein
MMRVIICHAPIPYLSLSISGRGKVKLFEEIH